MVKWSERKTKLKRVAPAHRESSTGTAPTVNVLPLRSSAWLFCALTLGACSGEIGEVEPGVLSLQLQPSAAVQLELLKYTVSHERGFVRSGPVAVGDQQIFTFEVDTLPPAHGYVVTAYAEGTIKAASAPTVCTGEASFEIRTAQATAVSMRLQCEGVASTGTEHGDTTNNCPKVGVISAEPAQVPVGEHVQLRAEAAPDDDGPLPVEYKWRADGGALSSPTAAQTRLLCKRAGVVTVQLTLSDGDDACREAPATVYVTCTDDTCIDLTHCPNSPAPPVVPNNQANVAGRAGVLTGQAGAAGRQGSAGAGAMAVDQDAGLAEAGSGATNTWPRPNSDNTPQRGPQGRRNHPNAGAGGQTHSSGGAGASALAGEAAPQPQAGAGGAASGESAGGVGGVAQAGVGGAAGAAAGSGAGTTAGSGAGTTAGSGAGTTAGSGAGTAAGSGGDSAGAGAGGASAGGDTAGAGTAAGSGGDSAGTGADGDAAGSGGAGAGTCSANSFDDCCPAGGPTSARAATCASLSLKNSGNQ